MIGMFYQPPIPYSSICLIAGRDTTAATLTFVIYFLSLYPEVTFRLRNEVLSKVGPARKPTYDDIKEMKYLRAVINGRSFFPMRFVSQLVVIRNIEIVSRRVSPIYSSTVNALSDKGSPFNIR